MVINLLTTSFDGKHELSVKTLYISFTVKPFNDVVITIINVEAKTEHGVSKRIINEIILHN